MKNNSTGGVPGFVHRHKNQLLFLMRVSLLNMALLSISLLLHANATTGQNLDKIMVTIEAKNESLETVLERIREKTELHLTYLINHTEPYNNISLANKERSAKETLDLVLAGTDLDYQQQGIFVFVGRKESIIDNVDLIIPPPTVKGTVIEAETHEPMAGVNVIVKGTTNGTSTDTNGQFNIETESNETLVFSFIGYKTFEILIGNQTNITITLEQDIESLKEVVVNAGYWEVSRIEKTGSISTVKGHEIEKQPISNTLGGLQGRMAGVYVQQNTGVPGGRYAVQIRGQNSLRNDFDNNGNRPLYIIDGVPFTSTPLQSSISGAILGGGDPLSSLNPADIESVEILKDADATAIYGSRGANGVVLITTKKGKSGKAKADINIYHGIGQAPNNMTLLNTEQYLEMRHEALRNDEAEPGSTFPDHDLISWDSIRNTDWQDELIGGTAKVTNFQGSISGGAQNTQFLISAGYYKETTVFPGEYDYNKYSINVNLNHTSSNNKFEISFSANQVIEDNNLLYQDLTSTALSLPPNAPALFDEKGDLNWESGTWDNPLRFLEQDYVSRTNNLIGNATVSYRIVDNIKIKTNFGYTETRLNERTGTPKSFFSPFLNQPLTGSAFFSNNNTRTWILEPQVEFEKLIGPGKLTILTGATYQKNNTNGMVLYASGYTSDALLNNPQAAANTSIYSISDIIYRYMALFGRVNYNIKDKYLINLTGRRDGSSRFGPGNEFSNFGALGVAWIFSNENLLKNKSNILSFGKLRGSYGTTGSDQIGDYGYYELWNTTIYQYEGTSALFPNNLFNPDFAWETNKKIEGALELAFLNDRFFLTTSYYRNRSSNQLVGIPLPATTGFVSIQSNFPAVVLNTGLEIEFSSINVQNSRFTWETRLNITFPRNKLTSFPDIDNSPYRFQYKVGESLGVKSTYRFIDVNHESGIYAFENLDSDENITQSEDKQFLKTIAQDYFGGIQNKIRYRGFELDILFQYVKQTGWNYLSYFYAPPGTSQNQPALVMDRWQFPGDITNIQKFTQTFGEAYSAFQLNSASDNPISDASFIRLKNVSLSYEFLYNSLRKRGIEAIKVYLQGQNILTVTNYKGLDPETQQSTLPPLRMLTGGVKFTF